MVIVTGAGPQSKVITPPAATAATTAADVQLAGVPRPMTRSGLRVSSARAAPGTAASPSGLPGLGSGRGGFGVGEADDGVGAAAAEGVAEAGADAEATGAGGAGGVSPVQPARVKAQVTVRAMASGKRTARC
jgi:hypothetical protein